MTKVAVVLAGCGYLDGAEIRESVLALLHLDAHGAQAHCFAPDIAQSDVINHVTGQAMPETRNVLAESARIARGEIRPLAALNVSEFDALVLPGGFGVAKNLSDLATKGTAASVQLDYQRVIREFYAAHKPIGAICIAPAVLAAALQGQAKPTLTIGEDEGTAGVIAHFGATHQHSASNEAVVDEANNIATTSAYMRGDARISLISQGIEKVVVAVLQMAKAAKAAA